MSQLQTKLPTDTWVTATWDEYIQTIEDPAYAKAKGYYYNGQMMIEAEGVSPNHASVHGIIAFAITLFCTLNRIPLQGLINYMKIWKFLSIGWLMSKIFVLLPSKLLRMAVGELLNLKFCQD
jgi:hypothetical protein